MVIFPLAVWKALANLSLLWTLRIYGAMITNFVEPDQNQRDRMSVVDGFLKACSSAHDLDIDHVSFSSIISTNYAPCFVDPTSLWNSPHLVFKNITSFSFFGRSSHDIAFFSNCLTGASNTLRRLKWSTGHKNHYAPSVMAQRVTQKIVNATKEPKPRGLGMLESLELWDGMPFTDQNIADILDALSSPLKELSVVESGFEDMALAALLRQPHSQKTAQEGVLGAETGSKTEEESTSTLAQPQQTYQTLRPPHCTTLQRLDLTDCPYLTTEMVQQIRDACPNLKELIGM
ncbi:hypothetical protein BGX27_004375 [Mortierella sp. AM989]|nr:hypothetical protein BGX27_004375 [Mortierella sp. AM989]